MLCAVWTGTWEYGVTTMYVDGLYQQGLTLLSFGIARIGKVPGSGESALVSPLLVEVVNASGEGDDGERDLRE